MKKRIQPPSWVRGSEIESWQYAYEGMVRAGYSISEAREAADNHIKHGRRQRQGGEGYDYEKNPSGGAWALGIAAVLGIGWLLLRPKKAAAKTLPPAPTPIPPIDTSVPFTTELVGQWAWSRGIIVNWDDGTTIKDIGGTPVGGYGPAVNKLYGNVGTPYFWSGYVNGQRVPDMLATNEYMAWYKSTHA